MKFIAKFFPEPKRKPNAALQLWITPRQTLAASMVVFLVALYPLLTVPLGRPTTWFGEFLFLLCAIISVFAPAALSTVTFIDIIRRWADAQVIGACAISLAGVAATVGFIYLRITV